jgi:hypothetical protein
VLLYLFKKQQQNPLGSYKERSTHTWGQTEGSDFVLYYVFKSSAISLWFCNDWHLRINSRIPLRNTLRIHRRDVMYADIKFNKDTNHNIMLSENSL